MKNPRRGRQCGMCLWNALVEWSGVEWSWVELSGVEWSWDNLGREPPLKKVRWNDPVPQNQPTFASATGTQRRTQPCTAYTDGRPMLLAVCLPRHHKSFLQWRRHCQEPNPTYPSVLVLCCLGGGVEWQPIHHRQENSNNVVYIYITICCIVFSKVYPLGDAGHFALTSFVYVWLAAGLYYFMLFCNTNKSNVLYLTSTVRNEVIGNYLL
jgi:hypothetical protein